MIGNLILSTEISGTVYDSNGNVVKNFSVNTFDDKGNQVDTQNFTNGIWTLNLQNGYSYTFQGLDINKGQSKEFSSYDLQTGAYIEIPNDLSVLGNNKILYAIAGAGGLILLVYSLSKKKKKIGKITTDEVLPVVLIGIALLGFNIIQKILTSLGIWSSQDTKTLDTIANSSSSSNFWSPNYYLQFSSYPSGNITTSQANDFINQITSSFGMFNDCEQCVTGVFRQMKSKSNVSFLAKVFFDSQGEDLLSYLRGGIWPQDRLSDADVNTINSFLSQLPSH